jgi:hypothetical protein
LFITFPELLCCVAVGGGMMLALMIMCRDHSDPLVNLLRQDI